MSNRVEFLRQPECISFGEDVDKLETVICLESVLDPYYQALEELVCDETIRKECQRFEQHVQYHQKELRRLFPLSQECEAAVDDKVCKYLMQLKPPYMFLRALINPAISLTANKMDIYKYFSRTDHEHHELLYNFFRDSIEEMNFLRHIPSLSLVLQ